jgi:hypothetical protein
MSNDSMDSQGRSFSDAAADASAPEPAGVTHHFTLVHGTFARGAEWAQSQSALCCALVKALGSNIVLKPFDWSGKNSHSARVTAGQELATFLRSARESYPNAMQFVICHSHGGNVALYAHRELARDSNAPTVIRHAKLTP